MVAGAILILTLPVVPLLKGVFLLLWTASGLLELRAARIGMSRIARIRVRHDGRIDGWDAGGGEHSLRLLPGSVVLGRLAWLRLSFADGLRYGELLSGNAREDEDWRRFLVIWRQQASVFGGRKRS